mmetsp:Transcript_45809/g.111533  ORF Transcript_45809/g.111533 Transcript_45809/m.111533 type:complete len:199 (-) Transcript_45809:1238-1834(-)
MPVSRAISSSCVPCSTMAPWSRTTILSAFVTVESLCAIMIVVQRPSTDVGEMMLSIEACTTLSLSVSSALVASSSSSTRGCRTSARAMHTRCRCPPESCVLLTDVPAIVWYCCGSAEMKSCAFAALAAATHFPSTSASTPSLPPPCPPRIKPGRPIAMFSTIGTPNRRGSCCTSPIWSRSDLRCQSLTCTPSTKICPS